MKRTYDPDYQVKAKNNPDQKTLKKWGGNPAEMEDKNGRKT